MPPNPWEEKWETSERIGRGGQGSTIKARNRDTGAIGALKKLNNNRDETARARMHQEAAALQLLQTKKARICQLLDHNTEKHNDPNFPQLYLVTKYIEGKTLREFIVEHGVLDFDTAVELILKLADILSVAHQENLIHRDIKPDNIILENDSYNKPVLIDFGLSFNDEGEELTRTEETFRNKFLDLPENNTENGDRRDQRSDITALVGIFFYCLTGERIGHLIDAEGKPPHRRVGCEISITPEPLKQQVNSIFDVGFSTNVASRFQTLEEFTSRLIASTDDSIESIALTVAQQIKLNSRNVRLAESKRKFGEAINVASNRILRPFSSGLHGIKLSSSDNQPFGDALTLMKVLQFRIEI